MRRSGPARRLIEARWRNLACLITTLLITLERARSAAEDQARGAGQEPVAQDISKNRSFGLPVTSGPRVSPAFTWSSPLCARSEQAPLAVASDSAGNVLAAGGGMLCKFRQDGWLEWARQISAVNVSSDGIQRDEASQSRLAVGALKNQGQSLQVTGAEGVDVVFVTGADGLHCVDVETGKTLWEYRECGAVQSTPLVVQTAKCPNSTRSCSRNLVVFGAEDEHYHAVDFNGVKLWGYGKGLEGTTRKGWPLRFAAAFGGNRIFVLSGTGLTAITVDGTFAWHYGGEGMRVANDMGPGLIKSHVNSLGPAYNSGIIAYSSGKVFNLVSEDGTLMQRLPLDLSQPASIDFTTSPAWLGSLVFVADSNRSHNGTLYCISVEDKQREAPVRWRYHFPHRSVSEKPTVGPFPMTTPCSNCTVNMTDVTEVTETAALQGLPSSSASPSFQIQPIWEQPIVSKDGLVYVRGPLGVYALDAQTGTEKWRFGVQPLEMNGSIIATLASYDLSAVQDFTFKQLHVQHSSWAPGVCGVNVKVSCRKEDLQSTSLINPVSIAKAGKVNVSDCNASDTVGCSNLQKSPEPEEKRRVDCHGQTSFGNGHLARDGSLVFPCRGVIHRGCCAPCSASLLGNNSAHSGDNVTLTLVGGLTEAMTTKLACLWYQNKTNSSKITVTSTKASYRHTNLNTSEMQAVRCVLPKEIPLTSGVFLSLTIVQQDQAGSLHFCSKDGLGMYLTSIGIPSSDVNRHTVYIVIGIIVCFLSFAYIALRVTLAMYIRQIEFRLMEDKFAAIGLGGLKHVQYLRLLEFLKQWRIRHLPLALANWRRAARLQQIRRRLWDDDGDAVAWNNFSREAALEIDKNDLEEIQFLLEQEYRKSSARRSRARAFMETLVTSWPQRADLWQLYINLEMKSQQQTTMRGDSGDVHLRVLGARLAHPGNAEFRVVGTCAGTSFFTDVKLSTMAVQARTHKSSPTGSLSLPRKARVHPICEENTQNIFVAFSDMHEHYQEIKWNAFHTFSVHHGFSKEEDETILLQVQRLDADSDNRIGAVRLQAELTAKPSDKRNCTILGQVELPVRQIASCRTIVEVEMLQVTGVTMYKGENGVKDVLFRNAARQKHVSCVVECIEAGFERGSAQTSSWAKLSDDGCAQFGSAACFFLNTETSHTRFLHETWYEESQCSDPKTSSVQLSPIAKWWPFSVRTEHVLNEGTKAPLFGASGGNENMTTKGKLREWEDRIHQLWLGRDRLLLKLHAVHSNGADSSPDLLGVCPISVKDLEPDMVYDQWLPVQHAKTIGGYIRVRIRRRTVPHGEISSPFWLPVDDFPLSSSGKIFSNSQAKLYVKVALGFVPRQPDMLYLDCEHVVKNVAIATPNSRKLKVRLERCEHLPKTDFFGKCDSYVTLKFGDQVSRSTTIEGTCNPVWDEDFEFEIESDNIKQGVLELTVYDRVRHTKDDFIGQIKVLVPALCRRTGASQTYNLRQADSMQFCLGNDMKISTITLSVTASDAQFPSGGLGSIMEGSDGQISECHAILYGGGITRIINLSERKFVVPVDDHTSCIRIGIFVRKGQASGIIGDLVMKPCLKSGIIMHRVDQDDERDVDWENLKLRAEMWPRVQGARNEAKTLFTNFVKKYSKTDAMTLRSMQLQIALSDLGLGEYEINQLMHTINENCEGVVTLHEFYNYGMRFLHPFLAEFQDRLIDCETKIQCHTDLVNFAFKMQEMLEFTAKSTYFDALAFYCTPILTCGLKSSHHEKRDNRISPLLNMLGHSWCNPEASKNQEEEESDGGCARHNLTKMMPPIKYGFSQTMRHGDNVEIEAEYIGQERGASVLMCGALKVKAALIAGEHQPAMTPEERIQTVRTLFARAFSCKDLTCRQISRFAHQCERWEDQLKALNIVCPSSTPWLVESDHGLTPVMERSFEEYSFEDAFPIDEGEELGESEHLVTSTSLSPGNKISAHAQTRPFSGRSFEHPTSSTSSLSQSPSRPFSRGSRPRSGRSFQSMVSSNGSDLNSPAYRQLANAALRERISTPKRSTSRASVIPGPPGVVLRKMHHVVQGSSEEEYDNSSNDDNASRDQPRRPTTTTNSAARVQRSVLLRDKHVPWREFFTTRTLTPVNLRAASKLSSDSDEADDSKDKRNAMRAASPRKALLRQREAGRSMLRAWSARRWVDTDVRGRPMEPEGSNARMEREGEIPALGTPDRKGKDRLRCSTPKSLLTRPHESLIGSIAVEDEDDFVEDDDEDFDDTELTQNGGEDHAKGGEERPEGANTNNNFNGQGFMKLLNVGWHRQADRQHQNVLRPHTADKSVFPSSDVSQRAPIRPSTALKAPAQSRGVDSSVLRPVTASRYQTRIEGRRKINRDLAERGYSSPFSRSRPSTATAVANGKSAQLDGEEDWSCKSPAADQGVPEWARTGGITPTIHRLHSKFEDMSERARLSRGETSRSSLGITQSDSGAWRKFDGLPRESQEMLLSFMKQSHCEELMGEHVDGPARELLLHPHAPAGSPPARQRPSTAMVLATPPASSTVRPDGQDCTDSVAHAALGHPPAVWRPPRSQLVVPPPRGTGQIKDIWLARSNLKLAKDRHDRRQLVAAEEFNWIYDRRIKVKGDISQDGECHRVTLLGLGQHDFTHPDRSPNGLKALVQGHYTKSEAMQCGRSVFVKPGGMAMWFAKYCDGSSQPKDGHANDEGEWWIGPAEAVGRPADELLGPPALGLLRVRDSAKSPFSIVNFWRVYKP